MNANEEKLEPSLNGNARWRSVGAACAVLVVFAGVVAVVAFDLRSELRAQVLQREGEVIQSAAVRQRGVVREIAEQWDLPVIDDPLEIALHTSRWPVLAIRLYDSAGGFLDSIPVEVYEGSVPPGDLNTLGDGGSVARFHSEFSLASLFLVREEGTGAPMLEVNIPLPAGDSDDETVIVQYWISGLDIAEEYSELDRRIFAQAGVAFIAGGLLIVGSLAWAFRRLASANRLLQVRAEDLGRANRELAQSARTSAIGAITAHLMHGLRNPLAGLEGFVAAQGGEGDDSPAGRDEWVSARESTRRLRALVNEVHGVMSDVQNTADFDVTAGEVCAGLCERLQSQANKRGIRIEISGPQTPVLSAREAGLGGLVLANLVQNAIEASPANGRVRIEISTADGVVDFQVFDGGSGLPEDVAADPFRPRRSSKPDGAGIGLAISRELARHGGGELVLEQTGSAGTIFRLRLPVAVSRRKGEVS